MTTVTVQSVLDPSLFVPDLRLKKKESILQELVEAAQRSGAVRDAELLHETLLRRERSCNTGLGKGVAVPHARSLGVSTPRIVVARSRRGVDWDASDHLPVQLVLLVLSPSELGTDAHLDRVTRAVALTRLQRNRQRLLDASDHETVEAMLREVAP